MNLILYNILRFHIHLGILQENTNIIQAWGRGVERQPPLTIMYRGQTTKCSYARNNYNYMYVRSSHIIFNLCPPKPSTMHTPLSDVYNSVYNAADILIAQSKRDYQHTFCLFETVRRTQSHGAWQLYRCLRTNQNVSPRDCWDCSARSKVKITA